MKILFVGAYAPHPLTSGGRIRSYYLLRELAVQHEVHLLALSHEPVSPSSVEALRRMCRSVETVAACERPGGPVWRIRRLLRNPEDILFDRSSPALEGGLRAALGRENWDLIFLDDMGTEKYIHIAAGLPIVLSKHNCEWRLLRQQARYKTARPWAWGLSWLEALAVRRYEGRTASSSRRVIVASPVDQEMLHRYAPGALSEVVPNGVNVADYHPAYPSPDHRLLFVGAMFWYPNLDAVSWFCKAIWPRIQQAAPAARLDLLGSNFPLRMSAWGRCSGIQVVSDPPDTRPYLARAAVFVAPLRMGSGTRLKILEAMAAGRAVVATSVGAEGLDLQPDHEFLLADSPAHFATACVQLLGHRARRDGLGLAGRQAVEARHDWSVALAGLNRICIAASERKAAS